MQLFLWRMDRWVDRFGHSKREGVVNGIDIGERG